MDVVRGERLTRRTLWLARVAVCSAVLFMLCGSGARAAPETKTFIYVVYDYANRAQRDYARALLKKFNQLGFTERVKRTGVSWVEVNYASASAAAQYLHIAPDDVVYFGILMADRNDRLTREMFRAHVALPARVTDAQINAIADADAHEFYYALADVVDAFTDKVRWGRQTALLDALSQRSTPVRLILNGKDISRNRGLMLGAPYRRQNIRLVMVAFSRALFKKLGADEAGRSKASGRREMLWIKKGNKRIIFEVGPQITDLKIYDANYAGAREKRFISPIKHFFAYPEVVGGLTFVPLNLVIKTLNLRVDIEEGGATETLTRKK